MTVGANNGADYTDLNTAISDVNAAGGGEVLILDSNYSISSRITPKSNVHVRGRGKGSTVLFGGVPSDYTFYTNNTISNFKLSDLTN